MKRTRRVTIAETILLVALLVALLAFTQSGGITTIPHAREAVLKHDLQLLREAIDNYALDHKQPPDSLQDLLDKHYIHEIPIDPITNKPDWVLHRAPVVVSSTQQILGLDDVHSASTKISSDGTTYDTW